MSGISSNALPAPPARRVIGILLTYYAPYFERAVAEFDALLRSLSPDAELVIVHNGPVQPDKGSHPFQVIAGDNRLREFTGWQVGLAHIQASECGDQPPMLVLANDTFCHHNKWGPISRWAFRHRFLELMAAPQTPSLAGELNRLGKHFTIDGLRSREWVATYLFAFSPTATSRLSSLVPPDVSMASYYQCKSGKLAFSSSINPELASHIIRWLTGDGAARWRGRGSLPDTPRLEDLQGKANSIICEKRLSAWAVSNGIVLVDVFGQAWIKKLRRLEALPDRLRRLLGRARHELYGG